MDDATANRKDNVNLARKVGILEKEVASLQAQAEGLKDSNEHLAPKVTGYQKAAETLATMLRSILGLQHRKGTFDARHAFLRLSTDAMTSESLFTTGQRVMGMARDAVGWIDAVAANPERMGAELSGIDAVLAKSIASSWAKIQQCQRDFHGVMLAGRSNVSASRLGTYRTATCSLAAV